MAPIVRPRATSGHRQDRMHAALRRRQPGRQLGPARRDRRGGRRRLSAGSGALLAVPSATLASATAADVRRLLAGEVEDAAVGVLVDDERAEPLERRCLVELCTEQRARHRQEPETITSSFGVAVEVGVVDRDGGPRRQLADGLDIARAEVLARADQRQHAEDAVARPQRHIDEGARPEQLDRRPDPWPAAGDRGQRRLGRYPGRRAPPPTPFGSPARSRRRRPARAGSRGAPRAPHSTTGPPPPRSRPARSSRRRRGRPQPRRRSGRWRAAPSGGASSRGRATTPA